MSAIPSVLQSTGFISRLTDNFVTQKVSAAAKAVFAIFKAIGNFLTGKSFRTVAQITPPTTESTTQTTEDIVSPEVSPSPKPKINWVELARQAAEKVKNDQHSGSLPPSGDPEVVV